MQDADGGDCIGEVVARDCQIAGERDFEKWGCIWISIICRGKCVVRNVYDFAAGDPYLYLWKSDQVVSACGDVIVFDRDVMARRKDYATVRIARYRII